MTDKEVTIIADNTNNSLIIGASPRYFSEVRRLIDQLDIELAQVAIQVLIAQVRLDNFDEFGVEVGLQNPILFQRSLFNPQPTTTTGTAPNVGAPGFNWNNVSASGNNSSVFRESATAGQVLTNYGLGRSNSTNGLGGFVFSAASNSVNILVRALRTQGRIEVLSRPQIITRDNQQALISVGQQVPIVTGSNVSGTGIITNTVTQQQVGIILKVLPQISPDGRIVMRVEPQISKVSESTVNLGNGTLGTIIDQTIASTTIDATDGKTVIIGGLISKEDDKSQRGIPWLGDLPWVGSLFRYRSQTKTKTELLIILTPHIIRNPMDAERVFMDESRKMSWSLDDVQAIHGALPGASFLKQNCPENGMSNPVINPFDQNYFAPNTTPHVDEKLNTPKNQMPAPGVQMPAPGGVQMPAPGIPQQQLPQQQQPQTNPGWLQPPYQQQNQGYIAPQAAPMYGQQMQQQQMNGNWKTTVSYAPVQPELPRTFVQTPDMPQRQVQPPGTGATGFAGGQQP
jgi:Flp pilus assembly secretin CpaC